MCYRFYRKRRLQTISMRGIIVKNYRKLTAYLLISLLLSITVITAHVKNTAVSTVTAAKQQCPNYNLAINGNLTKVDCSGNLTIAGSVNPGNIISVTLNSKTYPSVIADANGNFSVTITSLPTPTVSYYSPTVTTWAPNNPSCVTAEQPLIPVLLLTGINVAPRGTVSLSAEGGVPPYTVYVDNNSQGQPFSTLYNTTIGNLSSGWHTFKVIDSAWVPLTLCSTIQVSVN